MIDGHGPTRAKRRPEAPGDGSHSCAASGPGLKRRRPTSLIRDIRDRASGGNQINEASHHQGTTPRDRTRRHPPDQPGCSCNPRPPVRSTPEVPYMSLADEVVEVGGYGTARQLTLVEDGAPVLPVLTSDRTAIGAALLCWLRSRWRIENAFTYASAHNGIDTLADCLMDIGPDQRMVTHPARTCLLY